MYIFVHKFLEISYTSLVRTSVIICFSSHHHLVAWEGTLIRHQRWKSSYYLGNLMIMEVYRPIFCLHYSNNPCEEFAAGLSPTFQAPFVGWPQRGFFPFVCEINDLEIWLQDAIFVLRWTQNEIWIFHVCPFVTHLLLGKDIHHFKITQIFWHYSVVRYIIAEGFIPWQREQRWLLPST
jgi:hypothetical protein